VVDLGALSANLGTVRSLIAPGTKVLAAVKADAYGHGLLPVARHLEKAGVDWFGVATPSEALTLRRGGVRAGVLLLGPVRQPETIARLADAGVSLTLTDHQALARLLTVDLPRVLSVQIVVDTGMGRLGLPASGTAELARQVLSHDRLQLDGVWTHFADSDSADGSFTQLQLRRFHTALADLQRAGIQVPLVHAANSAAIVTCPEAQFGMVRAGIILYGHHASEFVKGRSPQLKQVMRLEAPVTFVKRVAEGTPVSYGGLWRAPRPLSVATVRIGYADGYPRQLTGQGWVSLRGQPAPIVGRICMDQLMVQVGDLPDVTPGERVILWGEGGPDPEELAASIGTVSYELLTRVGQRVTRVYIDG
jgi:alanine racemase